MAGIARVVEAEHGKLVRNLESERLGEPQDPQGERVVDGEDGGRAVLAQQRMTAPPIIAVSPSGLMRSVFGWRPEAIIASA